MCGRYTLTHPDKLKQRFGTNNQLEISPNFNAAPGQTMPVIVADGKENTIQTMKWGLVPSWAKDPKIGFRMINARSEGIETKPSFRHAFKKQRCLVPADGFYEWEKAETGKIPQYIRLRQGSLFAFAGLWEYWQQPDGSPLHTYTIITTEPNVTVKPIHDRMPVILNPDREDDWLNPDNQDPEFLRTLLKPYPANQMESYPVSTDVNTVANNDGRLIEPINSK